MRILVLSNLYPPAAMGGYEMSCRDVVERWRAAGHVVTVLTTSTVLPATVQASPAGADVRRELEWYWLDHKWLRPSPSARAAMERRNRSRVLSALDEVRPDVVSMWNMGGMSLSLLGTLARCGVPVVANVCDDWLDYGPRVDAWMHAWSTRPRLAPIAQRLMRVPTAMPDLDRWSFTFVSEFTRTRAQERTRWSFPRSTVVGSGVDAVDFPLQPLTQPRPWRWRLLAVGRIEPRKGFDVAVRALASLPAARLRLLGVADPTYLDELHALAAALGVSDRLDIAVAPRAMLAREYGAADVLIFPSRWDEPFGLVPLEAMTQGTPVIATRTGGSAEFLVDAVNCLEVPVEDAAAVAAAVQRLVGDADLRSRLAAAGAETAQRYTTERLAAMLEQCHLDASEPTP